MQTKATKLSPSTGPTEIVVSDVEALYLAVDNPSNAGKTIVLKPKTTPYVLTRHRGTQERLHKGRLELQENMSLIGGGNPSKCVIETAPTDLPLFLEGTNPRFGMIRAGRGENRIAKLTLNVPPLAGSGISTDLIGSVETAVRIERVTSGDPNLQHQTRGVDIRNTGTAVVGRHLDVAIKNCEFFGGRQGIRIANFQGTNDCQISVEMHGNSARQNFAGCLVTNHNSTSGLIEVSSDHDQFTENGVGCAVIGAIESGTFNRTNFTAHKLVSEKNNGNADPQTAFTGGILVRGAHTTQPNLAFQNHVEMVLKGCSVDSNATADVMAHGAFSTSTGIAGTENTVTISLRGHNNFSVDATDSQPPESGTPTNKVVLT